MNRQIQNQKKSDEGKSKKAYQKPELLSYGTIKEITNAKGTQGAFDNGMPPTHKVSL